MTAVASKTQARRQVEPVGMLSRCTALLSGWGDGSFDLPEDIAGALLALGTLRDQMLAVVTTTANEAANRWASDVVEAALAGTEAPTLASLRAARVEADEQLRDQQALSGAADMLSGEIWSRIHRDELQLFHESLLPALEELGKEVKAIGSTLGPLRDAESLLQGTEEQRNAWMRLPALHRRYLSLRAAAACVGQDLPQAYQPADVLRVL